MLVLPSIPKNLFALLTLKEFLNFRQETAGKSLYFTPGISVPCKRKSHPAIC